MTQEHEDLLLKDLCARLPYGVICKSINFKNPTKLVSIDLDGPSHDVYFCTNDDGSMWNDYDEIKPYLFPLSSMTEEQLYELREMFGFEIEFRDELIELSTFHHNRLGYLEMDAMFEWFNRNHFDYRGLIPMGLANDATGLNIY